MKGKGHQWVHASRGLKVCPSTGKIPMSSQHAHEQCANDPALFPYRCQGHWHVGHRSKL